MTDGSSGDGGAIGTAGSGGALDRPEVGWAGTAATSGGAGRAPTGREQGGIVRTFLWAPLDPASWRALLAILLGFAIAILAFGALSACFSTGGSLLIWLVGIAFIALGIELCRLFARVERWRMTIVDRRPLLPHAYRPLRGIPHRPYGPWLRAWAEAEFLDSNRWRDVIYILVLGPLATLELVAAVGLWSTAVGLIATPLWLMALRSAHLAAVPGQVPGDVVGAMTAAAVLLGLLLVPVAAWACQGLMLMHRAVVEGLLCVSPTEALRQDVERLRGSRTAALELEASELRRIERDLHDGAQQRLVALAIDLGLAEERIDSDPAGARTLVASAREQARQALGELRNLVRGTAPAILLDRGLVAALGAVAGGCPVPTYLDSALAEGERLPPAVERAAYFVVAESLANAAKHGSATRCDVRLSRDAGSLTVEVGDDGVGGAVLVPGGGLAGLRDRVEALDGSLALSSPGGGPTLVHVELPIRPA